MEKGDREQYTQIIDIFHITVTVVCSENASIYALIHAISRYEAKVSPNN